MNGGLAMPRWVRLAVGAAVLVAVAGCTTTRELTTRDGYSQLQAAPSITVYARHDRVYALQSYTLGDSLIHGLGTLKEQGRSTPFAGDIAFSEILAIRTSSPAVMKTLLVVGITALFVAELIAITRTGGGLDRTIGTTYRTPASGSGSSCPYVYAWDGARYRLQAEPFGVAWGRALELTTSHLLPAARPEGGVVRVRLTNERLETHYVNSVALFRIELGSARAAVLDGEGVAWPLYRPAAPVLASDRSGRDILPRLARVDDRSWACDPSSLTADSGYEDVIETSFTRPREAAAGSLVLTAINSTLSSTFYGHLCRWVGDQTPALAHAVETDPRLIATLRDYTRDASLAVSVWDGHAWLAAGAFLPEANAVTFTRALRIRVPDGAGDTVRVRLRSMADVWRIDALTVDWHDARPLPMSRLDLRSATGPSGEDLRSEIAADDDRYALLLPPERVDLAFASGAKRRGGKVAYAVAARGYLMEWEPPVADDNRALPGAGAPADRRIAFLTELLEHRDLALAPVYEEWRKLRAR